MPVYVFLREPDRLHQSLGVVGIEMSDVLIAYLLPWLEQIERNTGKRIDLYNGVFFQDAELALLQEQIGESLNRLQREDAIVKVSLGVQTDPDGSQKELVRDLATSEAREALQKVMQLLSQAESENKAVLFSGD